MKERCLKTARTAKGIVRLCVEVEPVKLYYVRFFKKEGNKLDIEALKLDFPDAVETFNHYCKMCL